MKIPLRFFSYAWAHKKISVGVLLLLIASVVFWPKPIPTFATQKITRGDLIETLSVSGSVAANNTANLTFPISGKVVYIGVQKGDTVKQGQTIAAVDERTIEDNLQNAVKAAQTQQISFDNVNDFNGNRDLSDTGLSTSARRQLQAALNTLDQAKVAVEIQKIAKEQAYLISPIDGILTRADIQTPGVVATALATTYTVVDPKSLVFSMDVDQADVGKVQVGQPVHLVFDAYPDKTLDEQVTSIDYVSHTTTNGGNAFTVDTSIPIDIAHYRIGMNANADIVLNEKHNVLTVPLSSIQNNAYVYVKSKNTFIKQQVTLGLQNDTDAEVTSGLSEGDEVALDPTQAAQKASTK